MSVAPCPVVRFRDLPGDPPLDSEDSATICERVMKARARQTERLTNEGISSNAAMTPRLFRRYCRIDADSGATLERPMNRLGQSARATFSEAQSVMPQGTSRSHS